MVNRPLLFIFISILLTNYVVTSKTVDHWLLLDKTGIGFRNLKQSSSMNPVTTFEIPSLCPAKYSIVRGEGGGPKLV